MPRLRACGVPLACLLSSVAFASGASPAFGQTALVEKAVGKPTAASSFQSTTYAAAKGNDGSMSTRWSSSFADGQWWQVDLGSATAVSQVKVAWEGAYASKYRISTSTDNVNWTVAAEESAYGAGERVTSFSERKARYVRITSVTRGTKYGISFYELKVLGTPEAALIEKAQGRPTSASSFEKAGLEAGKANDGSTTSRWGSAWTDNQWWQVDLGSSRSISQVKVNWENAYASKYRISTSTDGSTWSTAAEETASSRGERTTSFTARTARYVRVTGITRATKYGISFYEAKVLGAADITTSEPTPISSTAEPAPAPTETETATATPTPTPTPTTTTTTTAPAPAPLWHGGYETGNFLEWTGVQAPSYRPPTIVTSPVRDGRYAARYELQANDVAKLGDGSTAHRSEAFKSGGGIKFQEGMTRWFGFSIMLDSSFKSGWGNGNQHVIQFKNDGTGSSPLDMRILETGRLALVDRRVYNYTTGLRRYWETPFTLDKQGTNVWHDFEMGVKFSSDPRVGWIEVRYNGVSQKMMSPTNRGTSSLSGDGHRVYTDTLRLGADSYIKQGYYSGQDMGFAGVVYHDAMRIGTEPEQVVLPAR